MSRLPARSLAALCLVQELSSTLNTSQVSRIHDGEGLVVAGGSETVIDVLFTVFARFHHPITE
ncbi:hypothetical protein ACFPVT_00850 [Corynebacterium choanae]|uniref:hypothetical protein n=1 Tax=Corynebacterium choanae TaxID=1862358 RepID=UPI000F4E15A4|nr:hypothetical protein [Corynebacterium choanae]